MAYFDVQTRKDRVLFYILKIDLDIEYFGLLLNNEIYTRRRKFPMRKISQRFWDNPLSVKNSRVLANRRKSKVVIDFVSHKGSNNQVG